MILLIINYISIDRSGPAESNEISFIIGTRGRMNSLIINLIISLSERFYIFYILLNYDIHNTLDTNNRSYRDLLINYYICHYTSIALFMKGYLSR